MEFVSLDGRYCTFRIHFDHAQQVKVVLDLHAGLSQIFAMRQIKPGIWQVGLSLPPGEYRFCYHVYDGRSLTCVTPEGRETDGLKGLLKVHSPKSNAAAPASAALTRHRPCIAEDRQLLGDLPIAG